MTLDDHELKVRSNFVGILPEFAILGGNNGEMN